VDSDNGPRRPDTRIVIVGVCGSGKSELARRLHAAGYPTARQIAQEHSYVPDMWQRLSRPDVLIYLDAEAATINRRQGRSDWTDAAVAQQRWRLAHARQAAAVYLATDGLTPDEVAARVLDFLRNPPE
jgi:hypothetical protein